MRSTKHRKRSSFIQSNKQALRQQFRTIRQEIDEPTRQAAAQAIAEILLRQPLFAVSQNIACYVACRDELLTQPIIEAIWRAKKNCYLPVLFKDKNKIESLQFKKYQQNEVLQANHYGILEPQVSPIINAEELDIVLTPLIAFDSFGHRLGTGGGYYDRAFEFLKDQSIQKPMLVGLAYAAQQAEFIQTEPWDIALSGVITEEGARYF